MRQQCVLIIGGGIGGLSTAIALSNQGFQVRVAEIRPDLHSSVYGVGIIQPVNALRALDVIGCAQACMEHGYSTTAWGRLLDVEGNLIREIPGARIPGSDLPPMNGITRPKLHEILTDKARAVGVAIEYGKTFQELRETPDGVDVTFNDGARDTVNLVVGADGVRSKVRPYVLGNEVQPTYLGQSAFRCNIPRLPEIDRIIMQKSAQGMAGFVPIGKDLAYLFYNSTRDINDRPDRDKMNEALRDNLAHYGGLVGQVRDHYINDPTKVFLHAEDWLIAAPPWHKGRIVLIGDAVHTVTPHMGQGAAQAIEDGIVLAECLATADHHEAAFNRYTERRYERCKLVVESSAQIGRWQMGSQPTMEQAALQAGLTQRVIESMVQPI